MNLDKIPERFNSSLLKSDLTFWEEKKMEIFQGGRAVKFRGGNKTNTT